MTDSMLEVGVMWSNSLKLQLSNISKFALLFFKFELNDEITRKTVRF